MFHSQPIISSEARSILIHPSLWRLGLGISSKRISKSEDNEGINVHHKDIQDIKKEILSTKEWATHVSSLRKV